MRAFQTFINELGNEIKMSVVRDNNEVTVNAEGPTSSVEHTWTPMEADILMSLLSDVRK